MAFIGVFFDEKLYMMIKNYKWLSKKNNVILIKESNIENMRNITFETVIISNKIKYNETVRKILENATYLLVNADSKIDFQIFIGLDLSIITYGFNPKATVTVSSSESKKLLLCIQRNIITVDNIIIEPQEIFVNLSGKNNVSENIAISTLDILYSNIKICI